MTSETHALHFDIDRGSKPKREWRRGFRALWRLLHAPNEVELAFEISEALDSDTHHRALARMLAHPEGRRIYEERPSLRDALCDRSALEQMPVGSFGRAYLEHIDRHGLEPTKLIELGRDTQAGQGSDGDIRWMAERSQLTHDLWHVLSGYGADQVGEATLLLFSLAQAGGRANLILALGANLRMTRERGLGWAFYSWKAWRRGRNATCMAALPYEKLLPLRLADVRKAAGIDDPEQAHPGGVVRGDPVATTGS